MTTHEQHQHRILSVVSVGKPVTQRMVARDLGIALGLANQLVRRLIEHGWIEVRPAGAHACRYAITPAGLREKARLEAARLEETISLFAETRDRLRDGLQQVAAHWQSRHPGSNGSAAKRVVLYGRGEMAQIAYLAMCDTDLQLVGVVDDRGGRMFLGLPVHGLDRLTGTHLDGEPFGRIIVVTSESEEEVRARLAARGLTGEPIVFVGATVGA